jgi:predicted DNA-binding antitoxin AbrB/MazE fold protein
MKEAKNMTKTIEAIYEKGVFKPLKKVTFPEHERVKLTISPAEQNEAEIKKFVERQKKAFLKIAGTGSSGLTDVSKNHNKYLYGKSCRTK